MAPPEARRVLILVENLPVPLDRRVWREATTLREAGYAVSIICPAGHGCDARHEVRDGVHIYRHPLPVEGRGAPGYVAEYTVALFWEFVLAWRVWFTRGFDVIHACNPPDALFLVGGVFKLFGRRYLFDQHDACPELFAAKFGRRGPLYALMCLWERLNTMLADVVITSNESIRDIAVTRGRAAPERVHVVRSGPDPARLAPADPDPAWRNGRRHLVGYVGVMGSQDGLDLLLEGVRHLVHDLGRRDVQFLLIGGGPEWPALQRLARELRVEEFVTFPGFEQDEGRLCRALGAADVCVAPDPANAYNDRCTMNKVLEYMALAKAQVQFDLPEGRTSAGDASLYARPNDPHDLIAKVVGLLDDPDRARRMGAVGRRRIEETLAWHYEAPKLLAAYDQLFAP